LAAEEIAKLFYRPGFLEQASAENVVAPKVTLPGAKSLPPWI
jgi:hypothetical protein